MASDADIGTFIGQVKNRRRLASQRGEHQAQSPDNKSLHIENNTRGAPGSRAPRPHQERHSLFETNVNLFPPGDKQNRRRPTASHQDSIEHEPP